MRVASIIFLAQFTNQYLINESLMNRFDYTQVLMLSHVDVAMFLKRKKKAFNMFIHILGVKPPPPTHHLFGHRVLTRPYLKSLAKPFHGFFMFHPFTFKAARLTKQKNQESSFASPNSTFDQNMSSPLFKVNC